MALTNTDAEPPLISVVIPTFNRSDELRGLIACLNRQTLPKQQFEVVIVDDGSTDDTLHCLKSLPETCCLDIRFCRQQNTGPGEARNRGMRMARAPFLAFTDTDCRPFPDWLEKMLDSLQGHNVGAVGGAEAEDPGDTPLMRALHFCMTSTVTTGGLRGKKGKKLARFYPRTFNMAISRAAFESTGGFKPLYHGEDVELSFRIKNRGFLLVYNAEARVYHKRRATLKQFFTQVLRMGKARVTLARLHPRLLEPLHVLPAAGLGIGVPAAALSATGDPFSSFFLFFVAAGCVFLAVLGILALGKTKSPKLLFLAPLVCVIQQCGYAVGFWWGVLELLRNRPGAA